MGMFSFAHLIGLGTKAEEEDKSKEDENTAEGGEEEKAEGGDEEEAEGEEDESDAEGEEDDKEAVRLEARKAERARCGAIFASPHAAGRAALAAHFAFNTGMSAAAAIKALEAAPKEGAGKGGLATAMQQVPNPQLGTDAGTQPNASAGWDKTVQKVNARTAQASGRKL